MKKIITICLSMMCLLTTAFAQYKHYNEETKQWKEYTSYEEYIFDESQFIFEGTVIKTEGYWSEKDKMIYTSNIIKIEKIFRGKDKIKMGTIEIVTKGGELRDEQGELIKGYIPAVGKAGYTVGSKGIFFCIPSIYEPNTAIITDNTVCLQPLTVLDYDKLYNAATGNLGYFKPKHTVYDFIGKHKNITIPKKEIQPVKKKDVAGSLNERKEQNKIRYARNVRASKKYV